MEPLSLFPCPLRYWGCSLPVCAPAKTILVCLLSQAEGRHVIVLNYPLSFFRCKVSKNTAPISGGGGCIPLQPSDPSKQHMTPFLPSGMASAGHGAPCCSFCDCNTGHFGLIGHLGEECNLLQFRQGQAPSTSAQQIFQGKLDCVLNPVEPIHGTLFPVYCRHSPHHGGEGLLIDRVNLTRRGPQFLCPWW
jgi:hypothetical protein